jgi:hypothetical protein
MTPSSRTLETASSPAESSDLRAQLRDLRSRVTKGAAVAPILMPENLGDPAFRREHGVRYAYATGAMANAIASERLVEAASKAGLLSFFGAAGLGLERVEAAILRLHESLGPAPHGFQRSGFGPPENVANRLTVGVPTPAAKCIGPLS